MSFAHSGSVIPQPFSKPHSRDPKDHDNPMITALSNDVLARDDALEHRYNELGKAYKANFVRLYDFLSLGFESTAEILASEIPSDLAASSYLDLGTGTGLTASACMQRLRQSEAEVKVVLIDGLDAMVKQARKKLLSTPNVATYIGDVTALPPAILGDVQSKWGISTFSLVTSQRVLLNVKKESRVAVLQHWKNCLSQGGKLVIDVPHPSRFISALMIGHMNEPSSPPSTEKSRPLWTMCCRLAEDHVWEECRSYARELARDAGLIITNDMPKALPECEIDHDIRSAFNSWLARSRAVTLMGPLTLGQMNYFNRRYAGDAIEYYRQQHLRANAEIAGVVVVLEHQPASASPTLNAPSVSGVQAHIKYEIDETLHGKDRKKAIKKAAKEKKKEDRKS